MFGTHLPTVSVLALSTPVSVRHRRLPMSRGGRLSPLCAAGRASRYKIIRPHVPSSAFSRTLNLPACNRDQGGTRDEPSPGRATRQLCYVGAMRNLIATLLVILAGLACSAPPEESASDGSPATTQRQVFRDENGATLALQVGKTLYLSAVAPADPQAPVDVQTRSAMGRLGETLGKAGLAYSNVVSCHVHLSDMDSYKDMNSVYGSFYSEGSYPARTTLELPGLPGGAGVLLMCVAHTDPSEVEVVKPPADEIPPAMGPYSPAVRAGSTVYLSGQGGRNPATGELPEAAGDQAQQTLQTITTILRAAGLTVDNVLHASTYAPPSTDPAEIDSALADAFSPGGAPSRASVSLARLPGDIAVEITFIAAQDNYITRLFMHDEPPTPTSSPASLSGGVVYTSAMSGNGAIFQEQFQTVLEKHRSALDLALMDLSQVVRVIAYLADLGDLGELRGLISTTFPETEPALIAVQAHNPSGVELALEMIAVQ